MALRSKAASKTEYNSRPFTKSNLAGRSFCLGVMPIPCPHFKITIVKRSQGQSAVAGAAYQSGERLFSEYDQRTKFYNKKKELVHAEIMLPSYAPPGYADRATLWNAVEAVENQWNSQFARRIVLAFPVEVPKEQYLSMIKEFCQEQFVSKGMIADFAIHDKGDGNPHAHILLTLRAIDEHGKWLPKARKVYDLDENGERIRLASGNWKCHKENTVDWNDQKYAEVWRHGWETITNRYLEAAGRPERVDLRSFERQGIQQIPTVHLGPAAHQMEKRGVETFLGNLNRDIRAANSLMQSIRSAIRGLQRWIADLNEKKQILLDALEQAKEPKLSETKQKILSLIIWKLVQAVQPLFIYEDVLVTMCCQGRNFTAKYKDVLQPGYTAKPVPLVEPEKNKDASLPNDLEQGMVIPVVRAEKKQGFTSPPKVYTEDTLLSAMETAGNKEFEKDTEKKGLGTPATRAAILEKLVSSGYVQRKGKQMIPTKDGVAAIRNIPDYLKSASMTAEWENALLLMERGEIKPYDFMQGIHGLLDKMLADLRQIPTVAAAPHHNKVSVGSCPVCGNPVHESKLSFCCADRSCKFALWKESRYLSNMRKTLDKKMAVDLLKKGRTHVKDFYSAKKDKTFAADLVMRVEDGRAQYSLEFPKTPMQTKT